jgi:sigma-B regulation protein RsbU (phosphoserine phosphatase)
MPLLARAGTGEIVKLDTEGFVLGTLESAGVEEQTVSFETGDRLLFYTDGVVEAQNPDGEQYSVERLVRSFRQVHRDELSEMLQQVIGNVRQFVNGRDIEDDLTLVVAEAIEGDSV